MLMQDVMHTGSSGSEKAVSVCAWKMAGVDGGFRAFDEQQTAATNHTNDANWIGAICVIRAIRGRFLQLHHHHRGDQSSLQASKHLHVSKHLHNVRP